MSSAQSGRLPELLRPLFWDCDFDHLDWDLHGSFIIGRVLATGPWNAVVWLRLRLGDAALESWIRRREGGPLSPKQLRFWQLILGLPREEVNRWLAQSPRKIWNERVQR